MTAYLGFKFGKTSMYREKMYAKQMEGYQVVFAALADLHMEVSGAIASIGRELNRTTRSSVATAIDAKLLNVHNGMNRWGIFLSEEFTVKSVKYIDLIDDIRHPFIRGIGPPPKEKKPMASLTAMTELNGAIREVVGMGRKHLGIEPLSDETLELIGKAAEKV